MAIRTAGPLELFEGQLAGPFFLDGSAESLPHGMGGELNLVVVGDSIALLDRLKLSGKLGRLLQTKLEFFPDLCLFRVHATHLRI